MPMLSCNLEKSLRRALALADARRHEYATLEHLLMALTADEDAAPVLKACAVEVDRLRANLNHFLDHELTGLAAESVVDARPTAGFQRVIQRTAIHVESSGRSEVSGANVLVALFSERESHAVFFLQEQNMSRLDAVNYISHGIAKRPGMSERRMPVLSGDLDRTVARALAGASARQHAYATLEHLLMALTDDGDAAAVLEACAIEVDRLRAKLNDVLDDELTGLAVEGVVDAKPTTAFQRVIEGAATRVSDSGWSEVTGASVLVALFAERDTQVRQGQRDTRHKVVLLHDHDTPTEFVVEVLERFFDTGGADAARVTRQIQGDGIGNCGAYPYEIAETKVSEVVDFARRHQHPLQCTMEKD